MSTHEHPIAMPVRNAGAGASRMTSAKAVALETVQTLSGTARDALFAYGMTGSAVASLAILAAPHLEMLLRGVFHGRGLLRSTANRSAILRRSSVANVVFE